MTGVHFAAQEGHDAALKVLLAAKAPADSKSADGRTPLHLAAENGRAECVRTLIAAGANPNSMTTR